jgi:twitching motility two-component system response regulator PilG
MRLEIGSPSTVTIVPCSPDQPKDIFAEAKTALNEGIRAAQSGDRLRARASLLRAAELDPRNENAWLWLASISEVPEELIAYLKNVLSISPQNERATQWMSATRALMSKTFLERGRVAKADGQNAYAVECFRSALDNDDRNAEARFHLAMLAESEEEKISVLETVLQHDPENTEARTAIQAAQASIIERRLSAAKAAAVGGNKFAALESVDAIIDAIPECTEAWMLRSHIVDSFAEKLECFERILSYDPNNGLVAAGRDSLAAIVAAAVPAEAVVPVVESDIFSVHADPEVMIEFEDARPTDEISRDPVTPEKLSNLDTFGVHPSDPYTNEMSALDATESQEMQIEFDSDGNIVAYGLETIGSRKSDISADEVEMGPLDITLENPAAVENAVKRVLVVDDSPTIRKLISGKLEKSGHDVACAEDGVDALAQMERSVPDLVLLDITMPRMDGYEVCKMIRGTAATMNVPVIMISGKDGFFDKVRGRMAGASGYITKPFGPETLMKTVESCLKGEMPDFE